MNIKKFKPENYRVVVTDFEITGTSFYGTDARFYFEIRDRETDILIDTDCASLEWCFMGYDYGDSEYLEEWLKDNHNIDYEKDCDYDYDKLPAAVRQEWEQSELEMLNDAYHDADMEDIITDDILNKLAKEASNPFCFYIIEAGKAFVYYCESTYFGVDITPRGNDNTPEKVFDLESESFIYHLNGVYFDVAVEHFFTPRSITIHVYERRADSAVVLTKEYIQGLPIPDSYIGQTVYSYDVIDSI